MEGVEKLRQQLQYKKLQTRKLDKEQNIVTKQNDLFNYGSDNGIEINMGLMINPGINTEYCGGIFNLQIENNKTNIETSKVSSLNINKIINKLITLSEAGNHLATILYQKMNDTLDNMTQKINEAISNLNNLVKYKDFSEIFDSTLSLESLKIMPISIIEESKILKNKITHLLIDIENGRI